jgi:hypothetical protein
MALYVPLDVDYAADPKIMRAGANAELLYVRALALAKRLMEDGRIDTVHLPGLCIGIPGKPATHALALVREGLWTETCAGWAITSWAKRNRSKAEIAHTAEMKRQASIKANHERWHINGKTSPTCPVCHPLPIRNGSQSGSEVGGHS